MNLLLLISGAFSARTRPHTVIAKRHADTHEYGEALHFEGRDWSDLTCQDWTQFSDALYAFTPEAFCYFLPGILSAEIKEDRPDLLVNSTLIGMLDRSQDIENWDTFFVERWSLLTPGECEAVQQWVLWISGSNTRVLSENSLMRAYETLETLAKK